MLRHRPWGNVEDRRDCRLLPAASLRHGNEQPTGLCQSPAFSLALIADEVDEARLRLQRPELPSNYPSRPHPFPFPV